MTSHIQYMGGLRTKATHLKSCDQFVTDAPTDNNGKGEAFSPTDLLATSLGSCMVTIMGIKSATLGYDLPGIEISVEKIMASNPRRVEEVKLIIKIPHDLSEKDKVILEKAGLSCPVAKSLHPDLKQSVEFIWGRKN